LSTIATPPLNTAEW